MDEYSVPFLDSLLLKVGSSQNAQFSRTHSAPETMDTQFHHSVLQVHRGGHVGNKTDEKVGVF
jgi:hypothetical protein